MRRIPTHTWLALALDILLLVLCALHLPSLAERARAPFDAVDEGAVVRVTEILDPAASPGMAVGDEILTYDGRSLPTADALEFLTNFRSIGDLVPVTYRRPDAPALSTVVRPVRFYRVWYDVIIVSVALLTWFLGVYVLLARPRDLTAGVLHAALSSLAVCLIIGSEAITPNSLLDFAASALFFVSYVAIPVTFFHFTAIFPGPRRGPSSRWLLSLPIPAVILAAGLIATWSRAVAERSVERFLSYLVWYDGMHLFVLVLVGAGIVNLIRSYRAASSYEERRKLQWVLWGLCIGPAPFLLLTVIPELFRPTGLIHEEFTLAFLVLIPLAFAVSVVKYHLFDVEQVIQRTAAYAIVAGVLLLLYAAVVTVVASLVGQTIAGAGGAILIALLFEPVRARAQRAVDKRFFRIRYSFREAQTRFMDEIKSCMDERSVAALTVRQIEAFIPVERIGFCLYLGSEGRMRLLAQSHFGAGENATVVLPRESPLARQQVPIALEDALEPGIVYERADATAFARWGIALLLPMVSGDTVVQGFIFLGRKKSGARFTPDDMSLLAVFGGEAGFALNRIRLQKELFEQELESRRLEELSQMKSDFVSYVSHELRTPLTSIKMFTQMLRGHEEQPKSKRREYLRIIEGETDRLGRMVTTILDAARIDQGRKEYTFGPADLREIGKKAMDCMTYQLEMQEFGVSFSRPARPLLINADADALVDCIINLIGNSIKYSAGDKWLSVTIDGLEGGAMCSVEDHGIGISPEAIPHLFERFYRDPQARNRVQGFGLGLSVVKHVMDAHGGRIDVRSAPGQGTRITLSFPLLSSQSPSPHEDAVHENHPGRR